MRVASVMFVAVTAGLVGEFTNVRASPSSHFIGSTHLRFAMIDTPFRTTTASG